jgi:hypothetical protein
MWGTVRRVVPDLPPQQQSSVQQSPQLCILQHSADATCFTHCGSQPPCPMLHPSSLSNALPTVARLFDACFLCSHTGAATGCCFLDVFHSAPSSALTITGCVLWCASHEALGAWVQWGILLSGTLMPHLSHAQQSQVSLDV